MLLPADRARRLNDTNTDADRTDKNLGSRITDFHDQLGKNFFYRIPLKFFTDLGLVNFTHSSDTKFIFTLESNLNKLLEDNKKVTSIPRNPNAKIIFHDHPYIQYQQILLDDSFLAYLNARPSYDLELAARNIQSMKLENVTSTYSVTGSLEYNIDNEDSKHSLYAMFVAYNYNGCSAAPLTQYRNNEIYQELKSEEKYFGDKSDKKIYINMRRSEGYTDS